MQRSWMLWRCLLNVGSHEEQCCESLCWHVFHIIQKVPQIIWAVHPLANGELWTGRVGSCKGGEGEFPPILSQGGTTPITECRKSTCHSHVLSQEQTVTSAAWLHRSDKHWHIQQEITDWYHAEYAVIIRSPQQSPNSLVWVPAESCQQAKDISLS